MRYTLSLSFLAISFLLSSHLCANTETIERIEQENSGYYKTIEQNKRSIASSASKIEKATDSLKDAKKSLAKYEEAFALAQEKYDQDPSPENLTILEMNKERRTLAINKVESREKRLSKLTQKNDQLTRSSSSLKALIEKNVAEINNLEDEAERAKLQAAANAKQKVQDRIVKAPQLPKPAVKVTQEPAPKETDQDKIVLTPPLVSTSTDVDNTTNKQNPPATPDTDNAKDSLPTIDTNDPVVNAVAELKQYLSGDVSQTSGSLRRNGKVYMGDRIKFSHLGGDVYSGEVELEGGENMITVDNSRFKINVPEENHGKIHVLYIDDRNDSRRLLFMEKSAADKI